MSQHIPPHHHHPAHNHHPHHHQQRTLSAHHHHTAYIHYPAQPNASPVVNQNHGIAPQDTTRQPTHPQSSPTARPPLQAQQAQQQAPYLQQPQKLPSAPTAHPTVNGTAPQHGPLVATGDWTKDLVHLAKTAELKKHALTLQLHTAHILSAHASLEHKSKTLQDIREQKNKLDSERARLLNSLREINEDRDKVINLFKRRIPLFYSGNDIRPISWKPLSTKSAHWCDPVQALDHETLSNRCEELRKRIEQLSDGEYIAAKRDVDRLRHELGQSPLPPLQATLEERKSQYLNERRLNANDPSLTIIKRTGEEESGEPLPLGKRPRGRPKGSKNRAKSGTSEAPPVSSS
ncbi:hypothetical protein JOM56_003141 [Amanita muscaria]